MTTFTPEQAPADSSGNDLVRVSVTAGERRVDLALPGGVPVAELLPELVRSLGMLDAQVVHAGFTLVGSDGRPLAGDAGLVAQQVQDGAVLTVASGADERPPRVYDDIVEAMSDAVEEDMSPWKPAASRRTALATAALLMGIGAAALVSLRVSVLAGAAAGVVALLLVVAAVVLSQLKDEDDAAVTLAWLGAAYAAASGFTATPGPPSGGSPHGPRRCGPAGGRPGRRAGAQAPTRPALPGGGRRPGRRRGGRGRGAHRLRGRPGGRRGRAAGRGRRDRRPADRAGHDPLGGAGGVHPRRPGRRPEDISEEGVRRDARTAHDVMLAVAASVGLLVALLAPLVVHRGVTGALLGVCAAAVVMLRTRQYRVAAEVALGSGSASPPSAPSPCRRCSSTRVGAPASA